MRLKILLFFSVGTLVVGILGCTMSNLDRSNPANIPIATMLITSPTLTPFSVQPTTTPMVVVQNIPLSTPFPAWTTKFADPILAALAGQKPEFQDDFSLICINESNRNKWKVCSTPESRLNQNPLVLVTARPTLDLQPDLQNGYSLLNRGWFYIISDSVKNPYYAHIENGILLLHLPEGKEKKDSMVYNPHLRSANFVLSVDFQFDETQPDATMRFQFNQSADQSVALDVSKDKRWAFHWGRRDNLQTRMGVFEYFPPESIRIVIIAQGNHCAVYLNDAPLDYFNDCRTDAIVQQIPQAVSFHLLAEPGNSASVIIDNVKLWDLDKIPGLSKTILP